MEFFAHDDMVTIVTRSLVFRRTMGYPDFDGPTRPVTGQSGYIVQAGLTLSCFLQIYCLFLAAWNYTGHAIGRFSINSTASHEVIGCRHARLSNAR